MSKRVLTDLLELVGLICVVAGIWVAFGLAAALVIAGVLAIGMSFLITQRGGKRL